MPSITPSIASPGENEKFDYVIIVPQPIKGTAIGPLKTWKEKIGFSVKIVTLAEIYENYPTGDDADRIWRFLHDRYPQSQWGIRYVLLVGDVDLMPIRMLYPDGKSGSGGAYGTDFYYANLDVTDWDVDNDGRWGEFTQDSFDTHAEVLVGRLPFNEPSVIQNFANAVVAFEEDITSWKYQALLLGGYSDITSATVKTDSAVNTERIDQDYFAPYGWITTTLFEKNGILPSAFPSDYALSQTN